MGAPSSDRDGIQQTIQALRAKGWHLVEVYDGEETIPVAIDTEAIDAIMAVDEATLVVAEGTPHGGQRGWVFFVLGNDPEEVICDHTINLSAAIDPLMDSWL